MTKKEAVKKVLSHEAVQPVPYSIKFTVEAKEKMCARYGADFDEIADTGSYVVASHTNSGWEAVRPGYYRDYFGVVWNKTKDRTLGVVEAPPIKAPELTGFQFPDPEALPVYGFIERNRKRFPEHFHMVSIGFALFERAWSLVGLEELMIYLATESEFVMALLDRITEYNIGVIRRAAMRGVDAVHLGDDWGSQRGPLISPAMWRALVKPSFRRTCQAAREEGLLVSLHCCGNVEAIMEDIVECGVDVFDPFQPEAMDIWKLRENYRGRMAFWGGLSVQNIMPCGTPDDVRRAVRRLLNEMAPGGGYLLSPAHAISGDVPIENVEAFLDVAQNQ